MANLTKMIGGGVTLLSTGAMGISMGLMLTYVKKSDVEYKRIDDTFSLEQRIEERKKVDNYLDPKCDKAGIVLLGSLVPFIVGYYMWNKEDMDSGSRSKYKK